MIPLVSIVIPTYNHAEFLRECLRSVVAQTVTEWEAIVVNNFSEDDTKSVVASFGDPRIAIVDFRNHGIIAASRNVGIRMARAEWIAPLDSDDSWLPDKLARCLAAARADVDVVAHDLWLVNNGAIVRRHRSGPAARATYRALLFKGTCLAPSASLIRARWLAQVGGFSEDREFRTAEDYELWLKLAEAGARFHFISEPLTLYRLHEANASAAADVNLAASLAIVQRRYDALERRTMLDALRLKIRLAELFHGAARKHLKAGRPGNSLAHEWTSLRHFPFYPKAWANIALTLFSYLPVLAPRPDGRSNP